MVATAMICVSSWFIMLLIVVTLDWTKRYSCNRHVQGSFSKLCFFQGMWRGPVSLEVTIKYSSYCLYLSDGDRPFICNLLFFGVHAGFCYEYQPFDTPLQEAACCQSFI